MTKQQLDRLYALLKTRQAKQLLEGYSATDPVEQAHTIAGLDHTRMRNDAQRELRAEIQKLVLA